MPSNRTPFDRILFEKVWHKLSLPVLQGEQFPQGAMKEAAIFIPTFNLLGFDVSLTSTISPVSSWPNEIRKKGVYQVQME